MTLDAVREDPSAYLVPEVWNKDEETAILEWCYEALFEAALDSWHTDPAVWPQNRNLKMFLEWFEVEFSSGVFDLLDYPIETSDHRSLDEDTSRSNGH